MGIFSRGPYCLAKPAASWLSLLKKKEDAGWSRVAWSVTICCSFLAAMVFVPSVAQAQTDAERAALVALYDATGGENWTNNTNWKTDEPVGDWYGVTVDNGAVTDIYLHSNNLRGELPSEIGNLTSLKSLNLGDNSLSGAIPAEIWKLTDLEVLYLRLNSLTGAIPTEIGNLTRLEGLILDNNSLSGAIPAETGNLTNLERLSLFNNSLTGAIPAEIGKLTNLRLLSLGSNFTGSIPAEIWKLTRLELLSLGGNLSGAIPAEIGNLTNLELLSLGGNLSGAIPTEIGKLTRLRWLWLDGNFSGAIPTEIGNLTRLEELWLPANSLTGAIPTEIGKLISLKNLQLHSNSLTGAIPAEIGKLTRLESLGLSNNSLTGAIPTEIGKLISLKNLQLHSNSLTGAIPAEIGKLTRLESLGLSNNSLTGAIPAEIGKLTNLGGLSLGNNRLSGSIPSEIGDLTSLERLILNDNTELTGELPAGLRHIRSIHTVDIRETCITTPADSDFQAWLAGIRFRDTDRACGAGDTVTDAERAALVAIYDATDGDNWTNNANWKSQEPVGNWYGVTVENGAVTELDLEDNNLRGTIPGAIGDLTRLEQLYLQYNTGLTGELPAGLRFLPIRELDIRNTCITTPADSDFQAWLAGITFHDTDRVCAATGVTVTPTALTVPEGGSATYTVVLTTQPSANVTIVVSFATGSDSDITVDKTSLTFTPDNWSVVQEVTVSAAEDDDATNGAATIEHTASGGGYDNVSVSSVTATEEDNDTVGVTVTPTALTVPEGSNAKYTVVLDAEPSEEVTISVSLTAGSDADITVDKISLTFTPDNWDAAQEVTVSAAEDNDATNGAATIEHTASGGGYDNVSVPSVTATEVDNDTAGVTVTSTTLTVPEGGNATYAVVLDTEPSEEVTISVSLTAGSDADITVDKISLTFTRDNWDAAQEVTVSAAEDDDATNGAATIEHTASGGGYDNVSVSSVAATELDNDTAGVTVMPTTLDVPEGGSATYTVVLDTEPSASVTISLSFASGSDEDITVDKTSLAFTTDNWSVVQEVNVSAAQDLDSEDDAALLNHRASGGDYSEMTIPDVAIGVIDKYGGVDVSGWLARSSRVGADHLLSSVEHRMERVGRDASGMQASVAGQRLAFGDAPARPVGGFSGASALWSASQDYTMPLMGGNDGYGGSGGYGASSGHSVRSGNSYGMSSGLNAAASRYRNLTLRDALSRSAFRYARETSLGNTFGIWGQGSFSRFSGSESGADMDGEVMSGTVGIDHSFSGWLHGLAVSRSESEGTYRVAGEENLSLSATLTGVYPYARYKFTDRLQVWGTGGYGVGSLRLQGDSLASLSSTSDLSMTLGSVGMSGDIVSTGLRGFGLSWQTDAMLLGSSLAASRSLTAATVVVHRLRLALKSSYILRMSDRASLAPKVQLGVRRDGGDAEQGMGVDVAGGLGFIHSGWGLRVQVDMHGLVVHEDSDFEEWGASGMILFDRAPSSELGMSWRLIPSWGSASSFMGGMRALWSRETVSGMAGFRRADLAEDRSLRLDSRFDYGFAAGENGVASPYASVSVSGGEEESALAGADVEVGGGLGYSNRSLGLRMRAGMRGLMSEEEAGFEEWGASSVIFFDPDPSSPLGASFNVSQSWGITPRSGFGGAQSMGTMREREPLPRSVTGISRATRYGQPMRIEGEMGYGFSASGGKGVATPYAGVAFSDRGRSGVLLGFNLQAGRRFLLNVEGITPKTRAISFDSMPEFRVRGLLKW